jgi:3-oxoacyl-[acyl-carrier protein] reductase
MELLLQGKTAIVTGAARGLGRSISFMLAKEGVNVVLVDIDSSLIQKAVDEVKSFGSKAIGLVADVSKKQDIDSVVSKTVQEFGHLDILVNNAGICPRTDFESVSEQEWDKVLAVNLKSVFLFSQAVFPHMKKQNYGRIINMASGAGKVGGVQVGAHYSASKAGVICLTKTLALNGAKFGITANAVCPGVIGTEMTTAISSEQLQNYARMIPLGRIGTAEDVANMVVFLASDAANYITGEIADVNGGFIMD